MIMREINSQFPDLASNMAGIRLVQIPLIYQSLIGFSRQDWPDIQEWVPGQFGYFCKILIYILPP